MNPNDCNFSIYRNGTLECDAEDYGHECQPEYCAYLRSMDKEEDADEYWNRVLSADPT